MPRLAVHVDADADRASVLWGEKKNEENMKIWRKEELQEKQNRQMGKKERRPDAGERTAWGPKWKEKGTGREDPN